MEEEGGRGQWESRFSGRETVRISQLRVVREDEWMEGGKETKESSEKKTQIG